MAPSKRPHNPFVLSPEDEIFTDEARPCNPVASRTLIGYLDHIRRAERKKWHRAVEEPPSISLANPRSSDPGVLGSQSNTTGVPQTGNTNPEEETSAEFGIDVDQPPKQNSNASVQKTPRFSAYTDNRGQPHDIEATHIDHEEDSESGTEESKGLNQPLSLCPSRSAPSSMRESNPPGKSMHTTLGTSYIPLLPIKAWYLGHKLLERPYYLSWLTDKTLLFIRSGKSPHTPSHHVEQVDIRSTARYVWYSEPDVPGGKTVVLETLERTEHDHSLGTQYPRHFQQGALHKGEIVLKFETCVNTSWPGADLAYAKFIDWIKMNVDPSRREILGISRADVKWQVAGQIAQRAENALGETTRKIHIGHGAISTASPVRIGSAATKINPSAGGPPVSKHQVNRPFIPEQRPAPTKIKTLNSDTRSYDTNVNTYSRLRTQDTLHSNRGNVVASRTVTTYPRNGEPPAKRPKVDTSSVRSRTKVSQSLYDHGPRLKPGQSDDTGLIYVDDEYAEDTGEPDSDPLNIGRTNDFYGTSGSSCSIVNPYSRIRTQDAIQNYRGNVVASTTVTITCPRNGEPPAKRPKVDTSSGVGKRSRNLFTTTVRGSNPASQMIQG
ncbi:hypothetical protein B0H11DRAFT_1137097 [Mycena galericulata]|nr:hypothetical protein B0H11DRAFT_1137097 [Mycena galericulata]